MTIYKRKDSPNYWFSCLIKGTKRFRCSLKTKDRRKASLLANKLEEQLRERDMTRGKSISFSFAIDAYLEHCIANGLAKNTVRGYEYRLERLLRFIGDEKETYDYSEDELIDLVSEYLAYRVSSKEVSDIKHDRVILSGFFNYVIARRWYKGTNPARRELHIIRKKRKEFRPPRKTTRKEDLIIRNEAAKLEIWPVVMLARWAGFRRGEACTLRWKNVNFAEGYADIVGEEGGRKHPRRVWLAPWIVKQLFDIKQRIQPKSEEFTVWSHSIDYLSKLWVRFREKFLTRNVGLHDLRASWVTEVHERGMTAMEESRIGGHSAAVADKYYSDFTAKEARDKLPPDPLSVRIA